MNHYKGPALGRNVSALISPVIVQSLAENSLGWWGKEESSENNVVDSKNVEVASLQLATHLAASSLLKKIESYSPLIASVAFYITYFKPVCSKVGRCTSCPRPCNKLPQTQPLNPEAWVLLTVCSKTAEERVELKKKILKLKNNNNQALNIQKFSLSIFFFKGENAKDKAEKLFG